MNIAVFLVPALLLGAQAQQKTTTSMPDMQMPSPSALTSPSKEKKPARTGPPGSSDQRTDDKHGMDMPGMQHGTPEPTDNMQNMPGIQMRSLEEILQTTPSNLLPQIGQEAKEGGGPAYRLEDLEAKALQSNPTLLQAESDVQSAQGRREQAGLWPNPTVGYVGDEIAGGVLGGGKQGALVEQNIILGRKLYLAQKVAGFDVRIAELEKEEQRYRIQNAIRSAYFQTLSAQELVTLDDQYVKLSVATLETAQRLANIGARDTSEVAMAEIELERAKLAADVQRARLQQEWENLRSIVGDPTLPIGYLTGKLDAELPQLDSEQMVNVLVTESPAIKIARESTARADTSVLEARRQSVPDLRLRAGIEQNFEQNELTGKPFGLEGFAEVRVELPIFNRNQGNVASARADLERSQAETRRIELQLRQQAAVAAEQYQTARATVERYQTQILPRTHRLYEMQLKAWRRMSLSYPQVLLAQQSLFTAQAEYIRALQHLRTNAVALSGFLLSDGLAAPSSGISQPAMQINLPSSAAAGRSQ
jgi:cobalt-zinc-cadmium efflux system outer membrane protein